MILTLNNFKFQDFIQIKCSAMWTDHRIIGRLCNFQILFMGNLEQTFLNTHYAIVIVQIPFS